MRMESSIEPLRVFMPENIPSLNKGEEAILDGILETLKSIGSAELSLLSGVVDIDQSRYAGKAKVIPFDRAWRFCSEITCRGHSRFPLIIASVFVIAHHISFAFMHRLSTSLAGRCFGSPVLRGYLDADAILVGHNGTFGTGGTPATPILLYPIVAPLLGKIMGKPVAVYGASIAANRRLTSHSGFSARLLKVALGAADLVTTREWRSHKNLVDIGVTSKAFLTADPAFLLTPSNGSEVAKRLMDLTGDAARRPFIGMTVTHEVADALASAQPNSGRSGGSHNHLVAEYMDKVVERTGGTFIFIPHCIGGKGIHSDDRIIAAEIKKECRHPDSVVTIEDEFSAAELKAFMASLDMMIGERVHAAIGAVSMCVPSVVITRRSDIRRGIFETAGLEEYVVNVEEMNSDSLVNMTLDILSRSKDIRNELSAKMESTKESALKNGILLRGILDGVKKGHEGLSPSDSH